MANASHIRNATQIIEDATMRLSAINQGAIEGNIFSISTAVAENETRALKMVIEVLNNMIETISLMCYQNERIERGYNESAETFDTRRNIGQEILVDIGDEDFKNVVSLRALEDKLTTVLKNDADTGLLLKPILSAIRLAIHHIYMMYLSEDTAGVYRTVLRASGYNPQINRSEILNLFS